MPRWYEHDPVSASALLCPSIIIFCFACLSHSMRAVKISLIISTGPLVAGWNGPSGGSGTPMATEASISTATTAINLDDYWNGRAGIVSTESINATMSATPAASSELVPPLGPTSCRFPRVKRYVQHRGTLAGDFRKASSGALAAPLTRSKAPQRRGSRPKHLGTHSDMLNQCLEYCDEPDEE